MRNFEELTEEEQAQVAIAYFNASKKESGIDTSVVTSPAQINIAMVNYEANKKGYILMYIMSAVFGWSGLHMLHIGFKRTAAFRFIFTPIALLAFSWGVEDWATAIFSIGLLWWLTDVVTIPFYVNYYNKKLAKKYGVYHEL